MIRYPLYGGVAECAGGADRNRDQRTEHHGRSVPGRDPDAAQHGLGTTYTYGSNANGTFLYDLGRRRRTDVPMIAGRRSRDRKRAAGPQPDVHARNTSLRATHFAPESS